MKATLPCGCIIDENDGITSRCKDHEKTKDDDILDQGLDDLYKILNMVDHRAKEL